MKNTFLLFVTSLLVLGPIAVSPAHALSCLPVDQYLKTIVNDGTTLIFTATSLDRMDETSYTAEVLEVNEVKQGYVEEKIFAYHQNDETWGYLCNTGPKAKGSKGIYIVTRDNHDKYNVSQRLELTDPLIKTLDADLKKEKVVGEVVELPTPDRLNRIFTTINNLVQEIKILIKEFTYWKKV